MFKINYKRNPSVDRDIQRRRQDLQMGQLKRGNTGVKPLNLNKITYAIRDQIV